MTIEALLKSTEDVEKLAEIYVKALHAKRQWHFEKPESRGPLPPPLEEEGYMFKAGHASRNAEVERLKNAVRVMSEALGFYADRSNWTTKSGKTGITEIWTDDYDGISGEPYQPSCGKNARDALAKAEAILKDGPR